jgi:hypothetical protein
MQRRPKSRARSGVNPRTHRLDSDQRAARSQIGIRRPVGVPPAPGIARRRHIRGGTSTAEPMTRQWDGCEDTSAAPAHQTADAHPGEDRDLHPNAIPPRSTATPPTMIFFMPNPAPPPALATTLTRYSLPIPRRYGNDAVNARDRDYAGQPARIPQSQDQATNRGSSQLAVEQSGELSDRSEADHCQANPLDGWECRPSKHLHQQQHGARH